MLPEEATEILKQGLKNVLLAYARYDKTIGYVQGMNLIVGAILFHSRGDEVSTFWIFVSLIENYEMRQIYQKGLPGLDQHGEVIQILIGEHLPKLHAVFHKWGIQYLIYFSDWLFTLFSKLIPMEIMHLFLDQFLKEGWTFFYKVCLSYFMALQEEILMKAEKDDFMVMSDIISILKLQPPILDLDDSVAVLPIDGDRQTPVVQRSTTQPISTFKEARMSEDDEMSVEQRSKIR